MPRLEHWVTVVGGMHAPLPTEGLLAQAATKVFYSFSCAGQAQPPEQSLSEEPLRTKNNPLQTLPDLVQGHPAPKERSRGHAYHASTKQPGRPLQRDYKRKESFASKIVHGGSQGLEPRTRHLPLVLTQRGSFSDVLRAGFGLEGEAV